MWIKLRPFIIRRIFWSSERKVRSYVKLVLINGNFLTWEQEGKMELTENSAPNGINKEYYLLGCDSMLSGRF
jgi:hypothetical protein